MSVSDFYVRGEKSFTKKLALPFKADFPQTSRAAHTRMYTAKVLSFSMYCIDKLSFTALNSLQSQH